MPALVKKLRNCLRVKEQTVVISARRQQVLEEAAKEIEAAGGTVLCVPTDISKVDDVKNLVSKTVETFGQLDILINNAGVLDKGLNAIDQIDYDDLNRCIVCQKL